MKKLGCVRIYRRYDFHVPNHKAVLFGYSLFRIGTAVSCKLSVWIKNESRKSSGSEEEARVATAFYYATLFYHILLTDLPSAHSKRIVSRKRRIALGLGVVIRVCSECSRYIACCRVTWSYSCRDASLRDAPVSFFLMHTTSIVRIPLHLLFIYS